MKKFIKKIVPIVLLLSSHNNIICMQSPYGSDNSNSAAYSGVYSDTYGLQQNPYGSSNSLANQYNSAAYSGIYAGADNNTVGVSDQSTYGYTVYGYDQLDANNQAYLNSQIAQIVNNQLGSNIVSSDGTTGNSTTPPNGSVGATSIVSSGKKSGRSEAIGIAIGVAATLGVLLTVDAVFGIIKIINDDYDRNIRIDDISPDAIRSKIDEGIEKFKEKFPEKAQALQDFKDRYLQEGTGALPKIDQEKALQNIKNSMKENSALFGRNDLRDYFEELIPKEKLNKEVVNSDQKNQQEKSDNNIAPINGANNVNISNNINIAGDAAQFAYPQRNQHQQESYIKDAGYQQMTDHGEQQRMYNNKQLENKQLEGVKPKEDYKIDNHLKNNANREHGDFVRESFHGD